MAWCFNTLGISSYSTEYAPLYFQLFMGIWRPILVAQEHSSHSGWTKKTRIFTALLTVTLLFSRAVCPSKESQMAWSFLTRCRTKCLVHPGVRDKHRVSEIDLSQPRHETAFWWRPNGPVTSQLTDRVKRPNYPLELMGIYVHINTHNKESLTQMS